MSAPNVIQLRQLLADKFPGLRTRWDEIPPATENYWPTGLAQIDEQTGGLPKGALTEIVAGQKNSGSVSLLCAILQQGAAENQIVALVDGGDSFDVTQVDAGSLSRLLWVRCRSADEAMKASDLLLRDGNVSLVLIDLAMSPVTQLRKISATNWYRFQRLVEETATVCVVFTSNPMVSPAQTRITLRSNFSLDALERDADELLHELDLEISDARQARDVASKSFA